MASLHSLSHEVLLYVLCYLDVSDVLCVSRLSKHWHTLAADPHLWKALYGSVFGHKSLLSVASMPNPTWKDLFRCSWNWRMGNAKLQAIEGTPMRRAVLDNPMPLDLPASPLAAKLPNTIVRWHGNKFFTASRHASSSLPSIILREVMPDGSNKILAEIVPNFGAIANQEPIAITEVQLDSSNSHAGTIHLIAFYTSKQFAIFSISSTAECSQIYISPVNRSRTIIAKYHHPLIVTCSQDLSINFHRLTITADNCKVQTIHPSMSSSALSFAPAVLSLEHKTPYLHPTSTKRKRSQDTANEFRVTLAYASPFYPSTWTVSVQSFDLSVTSASITVSSQHATAIPQYIPPPLRHLDYASHSDLITSIQYSQPFIVASRNDNSISVYQINHQDLRSISLLHSKTLLGHTAPVGSVAIIDGRCVSGGKDGVKVWDLDRSQDPIQVSERIEGSLGEDVEEADYIASVHRRSNLSMLRRVAQGEHKEVSWLGFDQNKIVSIQKTEAIDEEQVLVYNFE